MRVNTLDGNVLGNRGDIQRLGFNLDYLDKYVEDNHEFALQLSSSLSAIDQDVKDNKSSTDTLAYINLALGIICCLVLAVILGLAIAKRDLLKK